jgi:hypothetical protein
LKFVEKIYTTRYNDYMLVAGHNVVKENNVKKGVKNERQNF